MFMTLTIHVKIIDPSSLAIALNFIVFKSPSPNPKLWTVSAVGFLQSQDTFATGGWWHDQHILEATGEGLEKEEPLAWQGWWNEHIVCSLNIALKSLLLTLDRSTWLS